MGETLSTGFLLVLALGFRGIFTKGEREKERNRKTIGIKTKDLFVDHKTKKIFDQQKSTKFAFLYEKMK